LADAYRAWAEDGDGAALAKAAQAGRQRWLDTAQALLALHRQRGDEVGPAIEALLEGRPAH